MVNVFRDAFKKVEVKAMKVACSLKTNFARTTTFKNTYFDRIVEMWNSIPLDIRLSPSCAVFKSGMKKFLSEE